MSHVDALSRAPVGSPEETETSDGLEILTTHISFEDWLTTAQIEDPKISKIKDQLNKTDELTTEDIEVQRDYTLRRGRLFRRIKDGSRKEQILWVVPKLMRWRVVKKHHDDIGHFALDKTLAKLKENYWFPSMRKYVKQYISACLECIYRKTPSGCKPGLLHSIEKIGEPFHTLHLDHLGPFIRSQKGNCHLIVAVDGFTKFTVLRPVRTTGMSQATKFLEDIVGMFGAPVRLITDQGTAFTGHQFESFCNQTNIRHIKNATAVPRGNGQVERFNRSITPALASLCQREDERDWDRHISQVQWGLNNTLSKATGSTPFGLLFNYSARNPAGDPTTDAIRETFNESITNRRKAAILRIRQDQENQRRRYNSRRIEAEDYQPGDLVVVRSEAPATGEPRKTRRKYRGPYIVTKKLNYDRYQVEDLPEAPRNQKFYRNVTSVDKMKRFHILDNSEDSMDSSNEDPEPLVNSTSTKILASSPRSTSNRAGNSTMTGSATHLSNRTSQLVSLSPSENTIPDRNKGDARTQQTRTGRMIKPPNYLQDYVLSS